MRCAPPCVDHEALPRQVRELVRVCGLAAALRIVELRGGIRLVVPTRAAPDHWLVPEIGLEALAALVEVYAGEEIEVPRCVEALRAAREAEIARAHGRLSNAELARAYGYTERGIRKLRRRVERRERALERQGKLL